MKTTHLLLVTTGLCWFLCSCNVTKSMDDMNAKMDKTVESMKKMEEGMDKSNKHQEGLSEKMDTSNNHQTNLQDGMEETNEKTGTLVDLSSMLSSNTKSLVSLTEGLSLDARPALALALRRQSLDRLTESRVMEVKLSEATTFYLCQEFQVWKGVGRDDLSRREMLKYQASSEFFRLVKEWLPKSRPLAPDSIENSLRNLYALATTIHTVSDDQKLNSKKLNVGNVSMLSIIQQSLLAHKEIKERKRRPEHIHKYMEEVINNEELAIYLLRLRYNFLAGMALANVSGINLEITQGRVDTFMTDLSDMWKKAHMFLFSWEPLFEQKNVIKIRTYGNFIEEALKTKAFLKTVGFECPLDLKLQRAFSNMKQLDQKEFQTLNVDKQAEALRFLSLAKQLL